MKRILTCVIQRTVLCKVFYFIVAMLIYSPNVTVLFSQTANVNLARPLVLTGDAALQASVDSLKQVYLDMGMDDDAAEYRARVVIDRQSNAGITTKQGTFGGVTADGSIAVQRNMTYRAYTPTQLVEDIFVKGGACSSVSNVALKAHGWDSATSTWTVTANISNIDNRGLGYFSRGTSNFEMEEGLVLSTGRLVSIEGPNSSSNAVTDPITGTYANSTGDDDLNSLLPANQKVTNVSVLEFDFVPINNVITFRYVFASEEYSFFVRRGVNDVFGFFISGPGIQGGKQNIALLPTTQTGDYVVSIDNVNDGQSTNYNIHNCPPFTDPTNSQYYINIPGPGTGSLNGLGQPVTTFWANNAVTCPEHALTLTEEALYRTMEFNGRTVVLTATSVVTPCQTYHMKLAIGNVGDNLLQSGVFLEAYSFDLGELLVNFGSMNEGQDLVYRGCQYNKFTVYRPNADPTPLVVNLTYGGTALPGDITAPDGVSALPATVTIPANQLSVDVNYRVNSTNIGSGHATYSITIDCPCGNGGVTKVIDIYDPSDPNDFQAVATPACTGVNNGTISINTGTGGSGNYESSLDGITWQSSTIGYTGLAPDIYDVYIRDAGGCTYVVRQVSTYYIATISGSLDICPPTNSSTLTASPGGVTYKWYRDGTLIIGATSQTYNATVPGEYSVQMNNGICDSDMSDTLTLTSDNCLWPFDDYVQTFREKPVVIKVLDNDQLGACPTLTPTVLTPPPILEGTVALSGNQFIFTPAAGFLGLSTFTYQITCNGNTSSAMVTVNVLEYPDNIIDPGCTDPPPANPFTFNLQAVSPSGYTVSNLSIPLVGDIDNDGIIEIIVPGEFNNEAQGGYGVCTTRLRIFKYINNQIVHWQTLTTPYFNTLANPYSIAKVDNNDYAAIFLCTDSTRNINQSASANDRQRLVKYIFNGTQYVEQARVTYSTIGNKEMAQPMITDFNGDGIPEILVYDKVFNARTLALLADGGYLGNTTMSFGQGGHTNNSIMAESSSLMAVADIDGDGLPEVLAGDCVYKVNITNSAGTAGNSFTLLRRCNKTGLNGEIHNEVADGATSVADIDGDGLLDVIVTVTARSNQTSNNGALYVWNPRTGEVIHSNVINNIPPATDWYGPSTAFIGDIDNDGEPEICFSGFQSIFAYGYNRSSKTLYQKWTNSTNDTSGATTMSMFDFNQDGKNELVYRDEQYLRILKGVDGTDMITPVACTSLTGNEYPVIADVNNDGAAEIIVTGDVELRVYSSNPAGLWAPARTVWNQYGYNAVNINQNLTVPQYQLNPATWFPGADGIMGTADDIQPFNGYLMQQTTLDMNGMPHWLWPDVYSNQTLVSTTVTGDSVSITVGIVNQGEAAIGPPVYVTLYREAVSSSAMITVKTEPILIMPGDTAYVTIAIPDITLFLPLTNIVIRLNDNGNFFPVQPECEKDNNTVTILNPALHMMMKKHATLRMIPSGTVVHDGYYSNPVAILNGDTIEYRIEVVNSSLSAQSNVIIRDTLPAYLDYINNTSNYTVTVQPPVGVNPQRTELLWSINIPATTTANVTFRAESQSGVNVSQPLFINRAWVTFGSLTVPTNFTYHQGAGVSYVTFSAGFGGSIYNAMDQVIDYYTSPHAGIVIVPDEGYRFAGWSHADYLSLRHETIRALSGIMHYDTLTIYGNVDLRADFDLEVYPIVYHLNGGVNDGNNPLTYTIKSGEIILNAPQKEGDSFIGWTGSNGNEPQLSVTIPARSTGERAYFANFMLSARRSDLQLKDEPDTDRIWAAGNELFVKASKSGSILRVYAENGIVQQQQIILQPGETKYKLPSGLYIVTLNNGVGQVVRIE